MGWKVVLPLKQFTYIYIYIFKHKHGYWTLHLYANRASSNKKRKKKVGRVIYGHTDDVGRKMKKPWCRCSWQQVLRHGRGGICCYGWSIEGLVGYRPLENAAAAEVYMMKLTIFFSINVNWFVLRSWKIIMLATLRAQQGICLTSRLDRLYTLIKLLHFILFV